MLYCGRLLLFFYSFAGRKRKTAQQPAAPAAQPAAVGSTTPSSTPAQLTFADVVAGRTTLAQSVPLLVGHIQKLEVDLGKVRALGEQTYGRLQQER